MSAQVEPDDLGNLKDSMEHYLQDAAEPDFVEVCRTCLCSDMSVISVLHVLHAL